MELTQKQTFSTIFYKLRADEDVEGIQDVTRALPFAKKIFGNAEVLEKIIGKMSQKNLEKL